MKTSIAFKFFSALFVIGCGYLIAAEPVKAADAQQPQMAAAQPPLELSAINAKEQTVVLGKLYEKVERHADSDKYKFQIEFTNRGAAVKKVSLCEFSERNSDGKKTYVLFEPVQFEKTSDVQPAKCNNFFSPLYALANKKLYLALKSQSALAKEDLPYIELDRLNWRVLRASENEVVFEAVLGEVTEEQSKNVIKTPIVRIQKKYAVSPGDYKMECEIAIENLTKEPLYAELEIQGTSAIMSEEFRTEDRNIKKGFLVDEKDIKSRAMLFTAIRNTERQKVVPSKGFLETIKNLFGIKSASPDEILAIPYDNSQPPFLWVATTNKYFAAIVHPTSGANSAGGMMSFRAAEYYDLDITSLKQTKNASASYVLETTQKIELLPNTSENNACTLKMDVYWGPKDHKVFSENKEFSDLGYVQTIDFSSCCCPQGFIGPLAFGIVWLMNAMYHWMGPLGNYGIVIMFFVCLIRLALHPLTKSGQIQMMKMQKMSPKIQEIQRKYANNKAEMQKQTMLLYKEGGVSQMMFMVPMFLQMPIWIALWTAVSISIDLRGQAFLPFWITDLSGPDALIRFTPFAIPFVGWEISSLNLLPLLMGVVMYLQTKLTPTSQTAPASPEMAQQQKIMSVMMVALFPVMLYNGPSGVNLYIMSSIAAGVVEQYVIRKHLREKQAEEEETLIPATAKLGKVKKKKPKPLFRFDR
jgi:YidC/Oxa1 family membrane protein insertase